MKDAHDKTSQCSVACTLLTQAGSGHLDCPCKCHEELEGSPIT